MSKQERTNVSHFKKKNHFVDKKRGEKAQEVSTHSSSRYAWTRALLKMLTTHHCHVNVSQQKVSSEHTYQLCRVSPLPSPVSSSYLYSSFSYCKTTCRPALGFQCQFNVLLH